MDEVRRDKKRELYRLAIARSDITAALNACKILLGQVGHMDKNEYDALRNDFYEPLVHAIVINYARPFKRNKPYGALKPEWQKFASPQLKRARDDIIQMRDQAIAHSDLQEKKVIILPKGAPIGKTSLKAGGLSIMIGRRIFTLHFLKDIPALCLDLGTRLNQRAEDLKNELYAGKTLPDTGYQLDCETDD